MIVGPITAAKERSRDIISMHFEAIQQFQNVSTAWILSNQRCVGNISSSSPLEETGEIVLTCRLRLKFVYPAYTAI